MCLVLLAQRVVVTHLDVAMPALGNFESALSDRIDGWQLQIPSAHPVLSLPQADVAMHRIYVPHAETLPESLPCELIILKSADGHDRQHHPLVCYAAAGWREQPAARPELRMDNKGAPIRRFCFTAESRMTHVYYWHYMFD